MPETTTATLYISNGGRVACTAPRCGGSYLHNATRTSLPSRVTTPLDSWERLTAAEVAEYALSCEDCGAA